MPTHAGVRCSSQVPSGVDAGIVPDMVMATLRAAGHCGSAGQILHATSSNTFGPSFPEYNGIL